MIPVPTKLGHVHEPVSGTSVQLRSMVGYEQPSGACKANEAYEKTHDFLICLEETFDCCLVFFVSQASSVQAAD